MQMRTSSYDQQIHSRASTEPAWLQEIHGNSLFLAKQRGSYTTDMEGQEEAGEEEEGLLVLENAGEGNDSEGTFPPGIIVLLLQFKNNFFQGRSVSRLMELQQEGDFEVLC